MALIPCRECGEMISDQAVACPKCGCPVQPISSAFVNPQVQQSGFQNPQMGFQQNNQQMQQPVYVKKKDSVLSMIAAACALFTITSPIGIILALIDLGAFYNDGNKHVGSWFAIIFGFIAICAGVGWYMLH